MLALGLVLASATRGAYGPEPELGLLTIVLAVGLYRGLPVAAVGEAAGPVLLVLGGVGVTRLLKPGTAAAGFVSWASSRRSRSG